MSRSASMAKALELFEDHQAGLVASLKSILRRRKQEDRCSKRCPGFFIDADDNAITRCDECAVNSGYEKVVFDEHFTFLLSAQKLQAKMIEARDKEIDEWDLFQERRRAAAKPE